MLLFCVKNILPESKNSSYLPSLVCLTDELDTSVYSYRCIVGVWLMHG